MSEEARKIKAVGLVSGGLDSTLAARMLREQGIDVIGLNFSTGFSKVDHRRAVRRKKDQDPKKVRDQALHAATSAGVPVETIDISEEFLPVVAAPKHGYGRFVNPCIDCRILMLRKAREYADRIGAEIVFTGEVLGQRPMSQHRGALRMIEKESGLEGRLLRPLSALRLPPTRAETRGDVDRARLGGISGRSRREQMELVKSYGIDDFEQPSGGCCFLIDENFARRFRDLQAHLPVERITRDEILMLMVGRHFRLSESAKAVVGRDDAENAFIEGLAAGRWLFEATEGGSPLTLLMGSETGEELEWAARLTARYSDLKESESVSVLARRGDQRVLRAVAPASEAEIAPMRL